MQIYDILTQDHDELKKILNELTTLGEKEDPAALINQVQKALVPHSRAEEAVFYNTLRTFDDANKKVMHSFREHMEAESLLAGLTVKEKVSADWKATARKLKTALERHIEEEQGEIFSLARRHLSDDEAQQLGRAFQQLKQEKMGEGFLKSSLDLAANLMPPRFTDRLRSYQSPEKAA